MSCVSDGIGENKTSNSAEGKKLPSKKLLPTLPPEKNRSGRSDGSSNRGIKKAESIPPTPSRAKYQGVNVAARSKSFTKLAPSKQFYVSLTPPLKQKPPLPPVIKEQSYVGSRLAATNAIIREVSKLDESGKVLSEINGTATELPEVNGSDIELPKVHVGVKELPKANEDVEEFPKISEDDKELCGVSVNVLTDVNGCVSELPEVNGSVSEFTEVNGANRSDQGMPEVPLALPVKVVSEEVTGENAGHNETIMNGTEAKRNKEFLVAKEMMTSEKVFVDVLRLLNEDFRDAVKDSDIPKHNLNVIFNCLPQLLKLNEELLKEMEERIEKWDEIGRISDVIVRIGPFLKLYTSYIKSFSSLTESLEDACKKYPQFSEAVKQFERSSRCQRLCVSHYMLKPVQRIPQYKLLLQDYLKCLKESSPDYHATQDALAIVSEVAEHANETIKQTEHFEKLIEIQTRLSGGFQVITPGRSFLREGDMLKLCRKEMQTRKFFLFSDCLLHCSMASMGLFRVHHVLPLASMKVVIPTQEDYRNEFSIISEARSFTLSACSPEERDDWINCLNRAIENMSARRETFLQGKIKKSGLRESLKGKESLGNIAPVWIPDARVTLCSLCTREFSLTFRRHHCRACGKVVCGHCSANQAPVRYLKYEPVRVCDVCYEILLKDYELMKKQPKVTIDKSEEGANALALWQLKGLFRKLNAGSPSSKKPDLSGVLKEVRASVDNCSIKGYLHTRMKKTWKKQWFVLKDKVLYAFKAIEDVAALSSTPLLGFDVITSAEDYEGIQANLCFRLNHLNHASLHFYADNAKSAERWVEAMKEATVL